MSETAAQPDTEPVPPVDALDDLADDQPLSQREAVMEEIAAARVEELRQDGVDIPPPDAEEAEAQDGEPEPPEPEGDGTPREPLPGEPLYTVKVDGVERQVPLSEITASYQIQSAAQNRLDHANEVLRRARETEQGAQGQTAATAPAVEQQPRDGLDGIDYGELVEALQYGKPEVAAAALKKTVSQLAQTGGGGPDAAATAAQVEARVYEKLEWSTALNRFGEEYQDILKDPRVAGIAGSNTRELYQQAMQDSAMNGTPRRPFYEIFAEAGDKTREWRDGLIGQQAGGAEVVANGAPAVNLSEGRSARKRAAPNPPTPRSGRSLVSAGATGRGQAPKSDEQQRRDGIHEIQRARGQR